MELNLINFILDNQDWKSLLQADPFNIEIKENDDYMLFLYNQISSDFSNSVVKECRGIILRKKDYKPVCVPFFKFHNVQETLADNIDWSSARVQEKLDGSLIKVWADNGKWNVSTNGTIDAQKANLSMEFGNIKTFYDLFAISENLPFGLFNRLDPSCTYMFELVSLYNRIVVPYAKTEIYHIGTRNNNTYDELNIDIGVQKPEEYNLKSLDECLHAAEALPFSEEGYVVVDKYFKRVKIKSPSYVVAHHLKNNGVITMNRILDMIRLNGQDDFISIYPEYTDAIKKVEIGIMEFIDEVSTNWNNISKNFESRKELAMVINKTRCPSCLYSLWDKKADSVSDWLFNQTNERVLKLIGVE